MFLWRPGGERRVRVLHWFLVEVVQEGAEIRADAELASSETRAVTFVMSPDGDVAWSFANTSLAGEVPSLPLEVAPDGPDDLSPLPTSGGSNIDVTVVDRFGAAIVGATVRLTGVVAHETQTNHAGRAAFDAIPDGRYDIVAQMDSLAPSSPRVIDLAGGAVRALTLTLKPNAPNFTISFACGAIDIRSLARFVAGAEAVVHLKVEGQRTYEQQPRELVTVNDTRLIQVFKGAGTAAVMQSGGRIDRGDYIDEHNQNNLEPLNVGDEYVLFLSRDRKGAVWIIGDEEGAFRIRNQRVEPLGSGEVARAWKGRAATTFFEAISARVNR